MKTLLLFLLIRHCQALKLVACDDTNHTMTGDYICKVNQNYDKTKVPGTLPLILDSHIWIYDITEVDEIHNSITLQGWIALAWSDPNLSYVNKS